MKNRTNVKLSIVQFYVLSQLGEGWSLFQNGKQPAYLVKKNDAHAESINNFSPIGAIKRTTVDVLLKKKLIHIENRLQWKKWFALSKFGEQSLLSLVN